MVRTFATDFGKMVCLKGEEIKAIDLTEGAQKKIVHEESHSDWVELMDLISEVKKNND